MRVDESGEAATDLLATMTRINAVIEAWDRAQPEQWLWLYRRGPDPHIACRAIAGVAWKRHSWTSRAIGVKGNMAFEPNCRTQRADRARAKAERQQKKLAQRAVCRRKRGIISPSGTRRAVKTTRLESKARLRNRQMPRWSNDNAILETKLPPLTTDQPIRGLDWHRIWQIKNPETPAL